MTIDSNGVKEGLNKIEKVHELLEKIENKVIDSSNNLDKAIENKITGYGTVKKEIKIIINNNAIIIEKSNEFIDDSQKLTTTISNIATVGYAYNEISETPTDLGEGESIIDMGMGPLNKKYVENPESYFEELSAKKTNEQMAEQLAAQGLRKEDINRVLNGEITMDELFNEITSDPDRTRYKEIMESQYLQGYRYSPSESQSQLDSLNDEKTGIDNRLKEIDNTLREHQRLYDKRQRPQDGISDEGLYNDKRQLEEARREIDSQIIEITQQMNSYGDAVVDFNSMEELDNAIKECDEELVVLTEERNQLYIANQEKECTNIVMNRLGLGDDLDTALSTVVAYGYKDAQGIITYDFDVLNPKENNGERISFTYNDLYGNSKAANKLNECKTELDNLYYKDTSNSNAYFEKVDSISKEFYINSDKYFDRLSDKLNDVDTKINNIAHKKLIYESIKESIETKVNFYLENIDQYVLKEDFEGNSTFVDKLGLFEKETEGYGGIIGGYKAFTPYYETQCYQSNNYDEYTGMVLSYILSKDLTGNKNFEDSDFIISDKTYVNSVPFPDIPLLGITSTYKEMAIDYSSKWRYIMTKDEIGSFYYICNTEGYDAGYKYLLNIRDELDQRYINIERLKDSEFARENPVLASIGSVFKKPIEGIGGAIYSLSCIAHGIDISRSNIYSTSDTWRSSVSQYINVMHGDVASFFYDTGMSIADSGLVIALTAATGGSGSILISSGIIGSSVYLTTLNDALDRGLDDKRAVGLALLTAATESLMEGYSVGHLMGLEREFTDVLSNSEIMGKIIGKLTNKGIKSSVATNIAAMAYCIVDQAIIEGDEEFWTEILDNVWDDIISQDLSKSSLRIEQYKREHPGCSESEAYMNEVFNVLKEGGMAWLGGATSGVFFGFGAGISNVHVRHQYTNYLNSQLEMLKHRFRPTLTDFSQSMQKLSVQDDIVTPTVQTLSYMFGAVEITDITPHDESNIDIDGKIGELRQRLSEVPLQLRDLASMLIDCIDKRTGILSHDNYSRVIQEKYGKQCDFQNIILLAHLLNINGIFDDISFFVGYNEYTGEKLYATLGEIKPFIKNKNLDLSSLHDHLVSNGIVLDESSITYVSDGIKIVINCEVIENLSYEDLNKHKLVFSEELYQMITQLRKKLYDNQRKLIVDKLLRLMEYSKGNKKVRQMLKWIRDELPQLYDCLGNLVSDEAKEKLKYSAIIFESRKDYIKYLQCMGCSDVEAKGSTGVTFDSDIIISFIRKMVKSTMIHEGNHHLGCVSYNWGGLWIAAGLNEALTESFNHRIQKANSTTFASSVSYTAGTQGIDMLMDADIPGLTVQDFQRAYYVTHDLSSIEKAVDTIMGQGYFGRFLSAFDSILIGNSDSSQIQKEKIDKVITDIITTYRLQF